MHTTDPIRHNMDSESALTQIVAQVRQTFDFATVSVQLLEGKKSTQLAHAGEELGGDASRPSVFPLGRQLTSRILKENQPIVIPNFLRERYIRADYRRFLAMRGYRGLIGSALRPVNRPIGIMTCYSKRELALRPRELVLLTNFVTHAGLQIETTRLSSEIKAKMAELDTLELNPTSGPKKVDFAVNAVSSFLYEMRAGLHVVMGQNELLLAKPPRGRASTSKNDLQRMQRYLEGLRNLMLSIPQIYRETTEASISEERARLARELHDGLSQEAGLLLVGVANLEAKMEKNAALRDELKILRRTATSVYEQIRLPIFGLRRTFAAGNVEGSLEKYLREFSKQTGIAVKAGIQKGWANEIPEPLVLEIVQIAHEALNNVRKHARSRHAFLTLTIQNRNLRLVIQDDGRGFQVSANEQPALFRFGLSTMRERAESMGGSFKVKSRRGRGTEVIVAIPLER